MSSRKPPEKLVVMGRIVAPFGVRGWLKIHPFTATVKSLLAYPAWWVGSGDDWQEHAVTEARTHGQAVIAQIEGCADRDAALRFRGRDVAIARAQLPKAQADEYYWSDLIGLQVVNGAGQDFGRIVRVFETGANDVLVVQGERERLIPFIAEVIGEVDLETGRMRVRWDADY